ncbi:hypothetical protein SLA2020_523400 [Shorea laevis]
MSTINYLLLSTILDTEGYLKWRVGFGIVMVIMMWVRLHRDRLLMRARVEADQLSIAEVPITSAEEQKKPLLDGV